MQNEPLASLLNSASGPDEKDAILWQMAKKRAAFKWALISYFSVNCLLIAIWYFTSGPRSYFWPVWPLLGWSLGMAIQYFHTYHGSNIFSVENEYQKLKNKQ